jgi:FkbM family methyltransferase
VHIIKETMAYYPNFHIQLFHGGVLNTDKLIKANFMHQNHNWGNSFIVENTANVKKEGFQEEDNIEINLISIDTLMKHKKVALLKLDCEGCEWLGLLG